LESRRTIWLCSRCVSLRAMTTFDPDDFLEQFNTADIASAVAAADGT
jgi:hypothetical protein